MKTYNIFINKYDWEVTILYKASIDDIKIIKDALVNINCPVILILEALQTLLNNDTNTGFTYSNYSLRQSIMVLSDTTSYDQMVNSISHECYHLVLHIDRCDNRYNEEQLATLIGDLCMNIYIMLDQ